MPESFTASVERKEVGSSIEYPLMLVVLMVLLAAQLAFESQQVMAQDRMKVKEVLEKKVSLGLMAFVGDSTVKIRWDEKGQDVTKVYVIKDGKKVLLDEIREKQYIKEGRRKAKHWRKMRKNREKRNTLKVSEKKIPQGSQVQVELVWEKDGEKKLEVSPPISVQKQTFEEVLKGMKADPKMTQDTFPIFPYTLRSKDGFTELGPFQWFANWGSFLVFKKVGDEFVLFSRVVCPYQEQWTLYEDPKRLSTSDEVKVVAVCNGKYQVMNMAVPTVKD